MSEQIAETFEHNGYTVKLIQDEDAFNPRKEYDNAGTFVCFHGRYDLGDSDHGYQKDDFNGWKELYDRIVKDHRSAVILPLGLIDHSGISIYCGDGAHWCDPGGWDSGQIGFAFISRATAIEEWAGKGKRVTKQVREASEKRLRGEIETYDQYLTGDVYGFVIETPDGEEIDSCWGHFGLEWARQAAIEAVPDEPAPVGGESEDEAFDETLIA